LVHVVESLAVLISCRRVLGVVGGLFGRRRLQTSRVLMLAGVDR
jgi:hypothetical protein